jgi:hypothetical protein
VKRAIFRPQNIQLDIEHEMFSTPISPATLTFANGEEMLVALPKRETRGVGEYQFLYTVGEYRGENSKRARDLFGRPDWKHLYEVAAVRAVRPFSLDQVAERGEAEMPGLGSVIRERYRGQTQHHRIIRPVAPEHEPFYRQLLHPSEEPAWSAAETVKENTRQRDRQSVAGLSKEELARRLKRMDKQNSAVPIGTQYRSRLSQRRNAKWTSLLKALYEDRCQVCGTRLVGPHASRADIHHLSAWDGDASDRLENSICVCPNHHALFEIGALRWTGTGLEQWTPSGWTSQPLAVDLHLVEPL